MNQIIETFYNKLEEVLNIFEEKVFASDQKPFPKTRKEATESFQDPGVYVIYFQGEIVYVGETKAFASRINDHTYDSMVFKKAKELSTLKSRDEIRFWMSDRFTYKFLPCLFGRLELEMHIIKKLDAQGLNLWNTRKGQKAWALPSERKVKKAN